MMLGDDDAWLVRVCSALTRQPPMFYGRDRTDQTYMAPVKWSSATRVR